MGKFVDKNDIVHYTLRLNLTRPDHLLIYKTLQNLNKDVYKSINEFIIEALRRYIMNDDVKMNDLVGKSKEQGERGELDQVEKRIYDKVIQEVMATLIASIGSANGANALTLKAETEDENSDEELINDETLAMLSDSWS